MSYSIVLVISFAVLAFLSALASALTPAWLGGLHPNPTWGFFLQCRATCVIDIALLRLNSLIASFAFIAVSSITLFIGCVTISAGSCSNKASTMKVGGIITILGGLFAIVSGTIFVVVTQLSGSPAYSYSFALAWVAAALGIIAGATMTATARKADVVV